MNELQFKPQVDGACHVDPRVANASLVFSDVDETIIRGKSLVGFAEHLGNSLAGPERDELQRSMQSLLRRLQAGESRALINRAYYQTILRDRTCDSARACARAWFDDRRRQGEFFKLPVCRFLAAARGAGARIVLLSGSFLEALEPIAEFVGADDVVAAPLERVAGRFTGRLLREPTIDTGKLGAIRAYARSHHVSLSECAGIGDDATDLPFLSGLGRRIVPEDAHPDLLAHARSNGWTVLAA